MILSQTDSEEPTTSVGMNVHKKDVVVDFRRFGGPRPPMPRLGPVLSEHVGCERAGRDVSTKAG